LNKSWYSHYQREIHSTDGAFAALEADGSITAWGDSDAGGTGAPSGRGYVKIYSTYGAFAAVKADGSITAWGTPHAGGTALPAGAFAPPEPESPHALIEPSGVRAAKAVLVE
jgi:hypothetical protein